MKRLQAVLLLLRPTHWIKNAFVLAGVFFAGDLFDLETLRNVFIAFVAFCLTSSAIYALNDILDRDADRNHPRKRTRPIASGLVPVSLAVLIGLCCAAAALALAATVGLHLLGVIAMYLIINTAYSRWLKHVVLIDVFCIASGFILRLLAGTWGIGVPPSQWFILCTFLLSLFLGFSKRYAERMDQSQNAADKRAVVEEYSPEFLRILLAVTLACTLMTYGLYTMSPQTLAAHGTGKLIYTLPFAAIVMFKYLYLVMARGYGENLSGEILRDRSLLLYVGAYVLFTGFLLF
jgi:4-hydroxybenzoate polyprenyltransferase